MNSESRQPIGLLAGAGDIPPYFARKAFQNGIRLVSIGFTDEIVSQLTPFSEKTFSIGVGRAGKIFSTLKDENIKDIIVLGKVDKRIIFKPQIFDLRTIKFLRDIKNREDKTLLVGMILEMEKEGFRVLDQRELLREIYPDAGVLTERIPTQEELEDIEFGLPIAKKLADMEIGQTIVVKGKTVVAAEAVEGTDLAIARGCAIAKGKCAVIKVSRTDQDYRYDSPGVGPVTIKGCVRGGASILALEAGCIMVADQEKVVEEANQAGLAVVCV